MICSVLYKHGILINLKLCDHTNYIISLFLQYMASRFNSNYPFSLPLQTTPESLSKQPESLTFFRPEAPDNGPKLIIEGGSRLSGHVTISGSKNSALPILAATLCCSDNESKLENVPNVSDTRRMASILRSLGAQVEFCINGEMVVNAVGVRSVEPDSTEIEKIRGGFFVIGPLLARFGEAVVGLPGGCDIGARPIDIYIQGLRALGATAEVRDGKVKAQAANGKGLIGGRFRLDFPSVGATETLMMAAAMAEGKSELLNVAQEPEVIELAQFLTRCGADIEGAGTKRIYIHGKKELHACNYSIIPDRIEAGSFMFAAAITRSHISMSPIIPYHVASLIYKLRSAGCIIEQCTHDKLESVLQVGSGDDLKGFDIKTLPFPGFPTDLQPQTMAFLATCNGSSIVKETVFENRMSHVRELQKLGAKIQVCGDTALVFGREAGSKLCGSQVSASDLRGGMSLILAGLVAEGTTEISGMRHVDRGYENLEMKFQLLGANLRRFDPLSKPLE